MRTDLAQILGVPAEQVRCVCEDMGGNFGTRNFFYPEYALLAWAARRVGRPVKWTCERGESFLSDYQGRDLTVEAELALDEEGNFLAVRGSNLSNLGGHALSFVSLQKGLGLMSGVYRIPVGVFPRPRRGHQHGPDHALSQRRPARGDLRHRTAGRSGGRPPGARSGRAAPPQHDPAAAQPYANPLGLTYDSGDYQAAMDAALALADWNGFPSRRAEARRRGRLRGIGLANYVEITSGAPRERTEITVLPEGRVELVMGTMSSGQGHETSFAQLVTEWLGVPFDSIDYVAHDTDRVAAGGGSHSGRSMKLATTIIGQATDDIIDKGRKIASFLLETGEVDIEFEHGRYRVVGTDREIGIFEVAAAAAERHDLPPDLQGPLGGDFRPDAAGRELSLWRAGLRGRGRSRDRRGADRRSYRGRRCRPRDQSADPARSDAWRHCPGGGSGVAGE